MFTPPPGAKDHFLRLLPHGTDLESDVNPTIMIGIILR